MYHNDEIDETIAMTVQDINNKAIDNEYHFYRGLSRYDELNKYYLREQGKDGNVAYFEYEKVEDNTVIIKYCRLNSRMPCQKVEATGFVNISNTIKQIMEFLLKS